LYRQSEAGNEKYCYELHVQEVVSDSPYDIKKMLESCTQVGS